MSVTEVTVQNVAAKARDMIVAKEIDARSVVAIVRGIGEIAKSMSVQPGNLIQIIETTIVEVAKGRDGLLGTADDLIPASVVDMVKLFAEQGIVHDLATWASESAGFLTGIHMPTCVPKLFGCFSQSPTA